VLDVRLRLACEAGVLCSELVFEGLSLARGEREGKYGDVVMLAELLCGVGDDAGGLGANGLGSVEAEELATFVSGFYDSVRYESEAVVSIELECGFGVTDCGSRRSHFHRSAQRAAEGSSDRATTSIKRYA
jgi:hypothetical protein